MWRHLASNMISIVMVALFLLGGLILWGQGQYRSAGPLEQAICFQVPPGGTFSRASDQLAEQGAISSSMIFELGVDYTGKSSGLKAGSFLIEPGSSMQMITDQITTAGASTCGAEIVYRINVARLTAQVREINPQTSNFVELANFRPGIDPTPAAYSDVKGKPDVRFRIIAAEGVTSWQVVDALRAMDILSGTVDDLPAEGMLAPDSYEVRIGSSRADLLAQMQARQTVILNDAWASRAQGLPVSTPEDLLTLASIIEKETGVAAERRQVASVFVNRLNLGMRLQTDPTVIYGVTEGKGVLGRGLRQSELRKETPWNTYVITGLPPTPIANPGLAALRAAADPDTTPYLFFVADGTGGHAFATTLAEHNRNVANWRKIERDRVKVNNN
jgi:UPF0755 protein